MSAGKIDDNSHTLTLSKLIIDYFQSLAIAEFNEHKCAHGTASADYPHPQLRLLKTSAKIENSCGSVSADG